MVGGILCRVFVMKDVDCVESTIIGAAWISHGYTSHWCDQGFVAKRLS